MEIPKNLGGIEFLRNHPAILAHLIRNSSKESLNPYTKDRAASSGDGGFNWDKSEEGLSFWRGVLFHGDTNIYYNRYPERRKDMSSESSPEIKKDEIILLTTKTKFLNVNQND
jgi:hypothetical protein